MRMPAVVSACGDAGGAAALAPVLERLVKEGRVSVESYAYGQGIEVLARSGLIPRAVPANADADWCDSALLQHQPALMLVATSHNDQNHEKTFVAAARKRGIPSMALLDFWTNGRARFCDPAGRLLYVPDRIAVMDTAARHSLIAEGLPRDAIVVTGHPGLDALMERKGQLTSTGRYAAGRASETRRCDVRVLFVSQPLREIHRACAADLLGYDEQSVLDDVIDALELVARRSRIDVTLIIRPHPRESIDAYAGRDSDVIRVVVSKQGDARATALDADLVVGMTSMLLVEACYLGRPVVSIQPNRRQFGALPSQVLNRITAVYRREDIAAALERLSADPHEREIAASRAAAIEWAAPATPRVIDCVYAMISGLSQDGAANP